jgi:hypothetical protein
MGELRGHQWQPREIAAWAYAAGWKDAMQLVTAVAVCLAESQGYDHAVNVNQDGTTDRGLWQLNSIHAAISDDEAYDPERATQLAWGLWKSAGGTFQPWAAFTSGVYLHDSYVGRATIGVANLLGDALLKLPVPDKPDGSPYEHRLATPVATFLFRLTGCLEHLDEGRRLLGWQAAPKPLVASVQNELAAGHQAAKQPLP